MKVLVLSWLLAGFVVSGSVGAQQADELEEPVEALVERRNALVEMVAAAKQAVVFVQCSGTRMVAGPFGRQQRQEFNSSGSGVVVFAAGYVVTNFHVIENAKEITVTFDDRRSFKADFLAGAPEEDLALLKIQSDEEFPVIPLADDEIYLAEPVIAIGSPRGHTHSVSRGIVSGLQRDITAQSGARTLKLHGLIQTDAAINSGNSGGPLLNVHGDLLGINTVMEVNAENIGFAIPVTRVRRVLYEALIPQALESVWLGFDLEPATLTIASVMAGGPAAENDVRVGDRVLSLDGKELSSRGDWNLVRAGILRGVDVPLTVVREEQQLERHIPSWNNHDAVSFVRFGARIEPFRVELPRRSRFQRPRERTLLRLTELRPGGPAAKLGLEVGDLIEAVQIRGGAYMFNSWQDFPLLISMQEPGTALVVNFYRDRNGNDRLERDTELYEGRLVLE